MTEHLSLAEARRIALAAQGLDRRRRVTGRVDRRHLRGVLADVGLLQLDSVNVLARAHYVPVFSRLGPYEPDALDRMAYRHRELFEYWAHAASLLPVELQPLLRWRMARTEADGWRGWAAAKAQLIESVYAEVAERGPITAGELREPSERTGPWWGWSEAKSALEWLFAIGRVTVAGRRGFERHYDLAERVLPAEVLALPTPSVDDAHRELVARAARHHGVGTAKDLADYFRIPVRATTSRLAELTEAGVVVPVRVEGWRDPAWRHAGARVPRRVRGRALLSPFDPVVWERPRVQRLFGFDYRIEIYVPAPKRRYGYYVLPFLVGDELVARVDLKADRKAGRLLVLAAHLEDGREPGPIAEELAAELTDVAVWLGLTHVVVGRRGDLARTLATAVAAVAAAAGDAAATAVVPAPRPHTP